MTMENGTLKRVRTRFAPSPTGKLHVGTMRCAYGNWLFAKSQGGDFILRIDDTDLERSKPELISPLADFLSDHGLCPDETYKQSERFDLYKSLAEDLISGGHAIEDDGCIRLKVEDPVDTNWRDEITGEKKTSPDDWRIASNMVLIKSDGSPAYNFATAVDDSHLGITDIIRGTDHVSNTARQVLIFKLFGWDVPRFHHVGLLCHPSGKKLSKRDSDDLDLDVHPQALLNWLLRMGWGPRVDDRSNRFIDREKALTMFVTEGSMKASNAKIDLQKLSWLDKHYKKRSEKLL